MWNNKQKKRHFNDEYIIKSRNKRNFNIEYSTLKDDITPFHEIDFHHTIKYTHYKLLFLFLGAIHSFLISTNSRFLTVINHKMLLSFTGTDVDLQRHGGKQIKLVANGCEMDSKMRMVTHGDHFKLVSTGLGVLDMPDPMADIHRWENGDGGRDEYPYYDEEYRGRERGYAEYNERTSTDREGPYPERPYTNRYDPYTERPFPDRRRFHTEPDNYDPLLLFLRQRRSRSVCSFPRPFLSFYILKGDKCLQGNGAELVFVPAMDIDQRDSRSSSLKNFDRGLSHCSSFEISPLPCDIFNFDKMFKSSIFIRPLSDNLRGLKRQVDMVDEKGIRGLEDEKWGKIRGV